MAEFWEYPHNLPNGIEFYDSEEELGAVLDRLSSAIGWIIIEFNSLEDSVGFAMKEIVSTIEGRDAFVYALIANMGFTAKANALMNLYGEVVERCDLPELRAPMKALDTQLQEAARRRNIYAHADWSGISRQNMVAIKIAATRKGVRQIYRTFSAEDMEADLHYIRNTVVALEEFDETFNEKLNETRP